MRRFVILAFAAVCSACDLSSDWSRHQSQFGKIGPDVQRILITLGGLSTPIYIGRESSEPYHKFLLMADGDGCSLDIDQLLQIERFEKSGLYVACSERYPVFVKASVIYDGMAAGDTSYEVIGRIDGDKEVRYFVALLTKGQISEIGSLLIALE